VAVVIAVVELLDLDVAAGCGGCHGAAVSQLVATVRTATRLQPHGAGIARIEDTRRNRRGPRNRWFAAESVTGTIRRDKVERRASTFGVMTARTGLYGIGC